MKVYWFILKTGRPVRTSDVQKGLGLSTSSLAQYHIKKLMDFGYVKEMQTGFVVEKVETDAFFRLKNALIPFQVAYAVFFSFTLSAMLAILLSTSLTISAFDAIALTANGAALAISLLEGIRTRKKMP